MSTNDYSPHCHYMQGEHVSVAYIERAGSQSMKAALASLDPTMHMTLDPKNDKPCIGFIRHPMARLESGLSIAPSSKSLEEWVKIANDLEFSNIPPWLRPQHAWRHVTHTFRFEGIKHWWPILFHNSMLPHLNQTRNKVEMPLSLEPPIHYSIDWRLWSRSL